MVASGGGPLGQLSLATLDLLVQCLHMYVEPLLIKLRTETNWRPCGRELPCGSGDTAWQGPSWMVLQVRGKAQALHRL